jgi:hypothetical protein
MDPKFDPDCLYHADWTNPDTMRDMDWFLWCLEVLGIGDKVTLSAVGEGFVVDVDGEKFYYDIVRKASPPWCSMS